jgi:hypothetical protein
MEILRKIDGKFDEIATGLDERSAVIVKEIFSHKSQSELAEIADRNSFMESTARLYQKNIRQISMLTTGGSACLSLATGDTSFMMIAAPFYGVGIIVELVLRDINISENARLQLISERAEIKH